MRSHVRIGQICEYLLIFLSTAPCLLTSFTIHPFCQIVNVATLPGIQKYALAMPDIHQGYGFPIGGVAAFAASEGGIISPGGIGYDINCGVRLLNASISAAEIRPYLGSLATAIYNAVPSGVGRGGNVKLNDGEMRQVLLHGAEYMLNKGYGTIGDIEHCEEQGQMKEADPI